jgi:hypothetical protein
VQTAKSLEEGASMVVHVDADKVDKKHDGDLVHVTGEAKTDEKLADDDFGVTAPALKLYRNVEMYQWIEESHSETRKKLGGGTETTTTYDYKKDWKDSLVDSSAFKHPEDHTNPSSMPVEARATIAKKITLGAFTLPEEAVSRIDKRDPLPVDDKSAESLPSVLKDKTKVNGGGFYIGESPASPAIGDVKVSFEVVKPATVSLVADQSDDTFAPHHAEAGDDVLLLEYGKKSADAMFTAAQEANATLTWILRAVGFIAMVIGLALIFGPISTAGDVIPFVGSLLGLGTAIFSFVISLALSLVTIAIAWIFYRPLLGIPMLVISLGAIVGLSIVGAKKKKAAAAAGGS